MGQPQALVLPAHENQGEAAWPDMAGIIMGRETGVVVGSLNCVDPLEEVMASPILYGYLHDMSAWYDCMTWMHTRCDNIICDDMRSRDMIDVT